jgi:hypothetical protein
LFKFGAKVRKSKEKIGEKENCLSLQHKENGDFAIGF